MTTIGYRLQVPGSRLQVPGRLSASAGCGNHGPSADQWTSGGHEGPTSSELEHEADGATGEIELLAREIQELVARSEVAEVPQITVDAHVPGEEDVQTAADIVGEVRVGEAGHVL